MEQKILIIHSTDRNIERNFWGYFFQSCGIWYKSRGFGVKSSELDEGYKEMYLTNPDDMGRISQTDPNAVYVLNEKTKESLENIMKTLSRIYDVEIRFDSNKLPNEYFTGTIPGGGIQNALNILMLTSPFYYEMDGSVIVLKEK